MAYFQTDNLWVNRLPDGVADLVLDVAGGKVNVLDRTVLAELDQALDRVVEDVTFRLLVLRTGKAASFCASLAPKVYFEDLREGDEVEFQVRPGEKGPQAFNLKLR